MLTKFCVSPQVFYGSRRLAQRGVGTTAAIGLNPSGRCSRADSPISMFLTQIPPVLLGLAIPYATRSQSSNARWVCHWRHLISFRLRTAYSL